MQGRQKTAFEAEKRQSKYLMPVLKVLFQGLSSADRLTSYLFSHRIYRDIKVKPNRSCAVMPPLLLVRERNKLGFVHFSESFVPLYFISCVLRFCL